MVVGTFDLGYKREKEIMIRYRPNFFDQIGHQTTYASMGNKHFITK